MHHQSAMTVRTMIVVVALAHALFLLAIAGATPTTPQSPQPPAPSDDISSCLLSIGVTNFSLPSSPSYTPLLGSSIRNRRFELATAVVLPASKRELQRAVLCARAASLAIRMRSGGHSYEGLSYTTENQVPFVVIDLATLNRVRVHRTRTSATAWVQSGATLGKLYHAVGRSSRTLAFPAGSSANVGVGGHAAGGGFGLLARKFGLAADNVLDAVLIAPDGRSLTRATMDGDVFWAIRGGGGGSWGVVYAWKLRLVHVPGNVTVFRVTRTGPAELVAGLMHRWQHVGPSLPDEFYLSTLILIPARSSPKQLAMSVLSRTFPDLGLAESELSEVSRLESAAKFAGVSSVASLTSRKPGTGEYAKSKSDYVQAPISRQHTIRIVRRLSKGPAGASIQLEPHGGAMARVGPTKTMFPHRAGYLYCIQYTMTWNNAADMDRSDGDVEWLRSFYAFMAPYVSKNPRAAYVNYLDLDLGTNGWMNAPGGTSYVSVRHARS